MAQPLDTVAVALYSSLTAGTDFDIPEFDLSGPEYDLPGGSTNPALDGIAKLTNGDLTNAVLTGNVVTGTGTMDVLMNTFMLHLDREYRTGHITGAEYTKAYIASIGVAASNGVAFLLQRDQAYWQGVTAQMGIINSRTQLAIAKTQLAMEEINANTATVNYALTKAKIGTENAGYINLSEQGDAARAQTKDTLADGSAVAGSVLLQNELLEQQYELGVKQIILVSEQGEAARAETKDTLSDGSPVAGTVFLQKELLEQQHDLGVKQIILVSEQGEVQRAQTMDTRSDGTPVDGVIFRQNTLLETQNEVAEKQVILVTEQGEVQRAQTLDTRSDGAPVDGTVSRQNILLETQNQVAEKQVVLTTEQAESQRAQTLDTRLDGATVTGLMGKQKELYSQQITSYKRDAEVKAGKLWIDAWITMKTIDEGLLPPDQFTNIEINEVLATLKTNNVLGSA